MVIVLLPDSTDMLWFIDSWPMVVIPSHTVIVVVIVILYHIIYI